MVDHSPKWDDMSYEADALPTKPPRPDLIVKICAIRPNMRSFHIILIIGTPKLKKVG